MTERDKEQAIYNAGQQEAKHTEILKECRASQNLQMTSSRGYVSVQGWSCNIQDTCLHLQTDVVSIRYYIFVIFHTKFFEAANQLIVVTETSFYQPCSNHRIPFNKFIIGAANLPNSH